MAIQTEREIIDRALRGDTLAFRELVERHQSFAYRLAYRFTNNSNDAEDIVQEAFIRIWKNLNKYRAEVKFTTWLYKIIANLSLDFLKSAYRKKIVRKEIGMNDTLISEGSADQKMMADELQQALKEMTNKLTPKQQAVFILRDLEDLSMAEVAEILSMPAGNVKSNLYYARKKISELLAAHYQVRKMTVL